jgi:hypothetical protein
VGVRCISRSATETLRCSRSTTRSPVLNTAAAPRAGLATWHTNAGEQLVYVKRLGQVVVGPEVEGLDLVALGASNREHHNPGAGVATYFADDVEPVHVWQPQVKQEHVGPETDMCVERLSTGRGRFDAEVVTGEVRLEGS